MEPEVRAFGASIAAPPPPDEPARVPEVSSPAEGSRALAGTEVDGELSEDASGHFIVDAGAKRVFDYFLLAEGELDEATLRDRVRRYLESKLSAKAAREGLAAFERYLEFRRAFNLVRAPADAGARDSLALVRKVREQVFGADAERFFARERAHEDRILEAQDGKVAPPPSPTAALAPQGANAAAMQSLFANEQKLKELPPAERAEARTKLYGPEVAARLGALDAEDDAWAAKLEAYMTERDRIVERYRGDLVAAEAELVPLREQRFEPGERVRVPVLERIHDRKRAAAPPADPPK